MTVWDTALLVLPLKLLPLEEQVPVSTYWAVMLECVPTVRVLILVVTLLALTGISAVTEGPPSKNWMQPSVPTDGVTVAVKLTACPKTEGLGVWAVIVVVVLVLSVKVVCAWETDPTAVK